MVSNQIQNKFSALVAEVSHRASYEQVDGYRKTVDAAETQEALQRLRDYYPLLCNAITLLSSENEEIRKALKVTCDVSKDLKSFPCLTLDGLESRKASLNANVELGCPGDMGHKININLKGEKLDVKRLSFEIVHDHLSAALSGPVIWISEFQKHPRSAKVVETSGSLFPKVIGKSSHDGWGETKAPCVCALARWLN